MASFDWNWEAALLPCWGWYRRVPIARVLSLFYPGLVVLWLGSERSLFVPSLVLAYLVVGVGYGILYGLTGNWMLQMAPSTSRDLAARDGHTTRRVLAHSLFALVVAAVPVVPVIAAITPTPDRRARATAAMQSSLQNLVTVQDLHFATHTRFAASLDSLRYQPSPHVTVRLVHADSTSWAAEASYGSTAQRCRISVGHWTQSPADAFSRVPRCDAERGSY